jgi:hypothetical protein
LPKKDFNGFAKIVHQKAFLFMAAQFAFPAQNKATLVGVYTANHQSLARFHLSVFISDVHVLRAKVNHATLNLLIQPANLLFGSDKIFRIKYLIQFGINCS